MKIKLYTVGKPKFNDIFDEFLKRLKKYNKTEHHIIKNPKKEIKKISEETKNFLKILLDERGKELTSQEFANFLEKKENQSQNLAFFVGDFFGHSEEIKNIGEYKISLSKLTLPHDFAMIILVETLYRSFSILHNHPYHKD